jgi:hypothetical protein
MKKTIIPGNFIGSFKIGDNIDRNLETLNLLYGYYEKGSSDEKLLLIKPIVTLIAFIIEAILFDFRGRARGHTQEKSVKIPSVLTSIFQTKPNDQLNFYIEQARKHSLFGARTKEICDRLNDLRLLRNRVHIQNKENHSPRDEKDAFDLKSKDEAEFLLKFIMKYMLDNHPRPKWAWFGQDFILPF